jgi:hypothetical protein
MSVIKKVLANVTQFFTDAEKAKARDNIGVPTMALMGPPPQGQFYASGTFATLPGDGGWYYLLEDWHSGDNFGTLKKIRIAPSPDNQPWAIELDQMAIGTTVQGLYTLIGLISKIAPPAIKLIRSGDEYALMHIMDSDKHHISSTLSEFAFSYWAEVGNPASELRMTVLTVNINDYVDARQFKVSCTEV